MVHKSPVPPGLPEARTLTGLRLAAAGCRNCPLWKLGTQTVFGEGNQKAKLAIVGEQPGDKEDLAGRPFVGPAGKVLDDVLAKCGIARDSVYVTNAVKHFKWELRGKRRLHKTPAQQEIEACLPWLTAEVALLQPRVILCLGATAAKAVLGKTVRINEARGHLLSAAEGRDVVVTLHPAYVLRLRPPAKDEAYRQFEADVQLAVKEALA